MVATLPTVPRFRLDLAYDGTSFAGWARQPAQRTVQGVLEQALSDIVRRRAPDPRLIVAGRTDTGVHALGQVAHVDLTDEQLDALLRPGRGPVPDAATALVTRLNGILGLEADVVVHRASVAPEGFDARFSAVDRRYRYRVADTLEARDPLDRHRTVWHPAHLDLERMRTAAHSMLGLHDFGAFCRSREGATTIRTLQVFDWARGRDGVLVAELIADAFCHGMVRALVGATVAVGDGRLDPDRIPQLLATASRTSEFPVMPAKGLTLISVGYPPDEQLAERAARTRARRNAAELSTGPEF